MRARHPDHEGYVDRDGVKIHYEVYGVGSPTILLLPTWMILDSRFWKLQIPYLSRHYRVITFDPPGNGKSDRPLDPAAHGVFAHDSYGVAVLDATGTDAAVLVGLSQGSEFALTLMANHPDRVLGTVLIGPAANVGISSERGRFIRDHFDEQYPSRPPSRVRLGLPDPADDWTKHNRRYWIDHLEDFAWFFFGQCFSEPHSTKQTEDCVGWTMQTTGELLGVEWDAPTADIETYREWASRVQCPMLVIHGTADRIVPIESGRTLAELSGATLVELQGSGHIPLARDPVKVNLLIKDFVDRVAAKEKVPA
jgi:pimeloyl-ACP methyl ester carboxylesterase